MGGTTNLSNRPEQQSNRVATPPGTPEWITLELVEHTIRVWQPRSEERITPEMAVAMIANVGRLGDVLAEGSPSEATTSAPAIRL